MPSVANSISLLRLKLSRHQRYLSSAEETQKHVDTHYRKADHSPSQKLHRFYHIERHHVRGRDTYTMQHKQSMEIFTNIVHIMYIHGGAYVNEITARQWEFLASVINAAAQQGVGIIFTIPIYSIVTPQIQALHDKNGHAHAVMGFLKSAYRFIVDKTNRSKDIQIMGDEAGAGLAYALAISLDSRSGLPPPKRVLLLSPWLDVHLQNPAIKRLQQSDPTNRLEGLKEAGCLFAHGTDSIDPILAPLYARVDKVLLARMYVWTSDADICQADCLTLVYHASKKGIDMTRSYRELSKRYFCMGGLYPSWMFSTWTPEAKRTISEVVTVVREAAINQRSPSLNSDETSRRRSSVGGLHKGSRSWSSGSIVTQSESRGSVAAPGRPRGKSVHTVYGAPFYGGSEKTKAMAVMDPRSSWKTVIKA